VAKTTRKKSSPRANAPSLARIEPFDDEGHVRVVVESPKGAIVKFAFDPAIGALSLSRPLPAGIAFPFDFGFVPSTLAADGDPLDALVFHDRASYPGIVIACDVLAAIGLEEDSDDGERIRNDRLIVVPAEDARSAGDGDDPGLTTRWKRELEQFFLSATFFEDKNVAIVGWMGRKKARALIDEAGARRSR
jgi:inorganic pyrophosphatase